ncbi:PleD family two-component system response regulator [Oleomonas cavernae]|uniref:response regulator n=1 Tax=Oleomonas cavernae TaxID=2320859 RepID=UPI0011C37E89|nr:response regulator [Oleomonas cavernae]
MAIVVGTGDILAYASLLERPGSPTVLIIDADAERRRFLQGLLLSWQYQVITAYDGYSGLRRIMNDRPEILVVDADLQGWSPSTVIDGALRLGSRAMVVTLGKKTLSKASRVSRHRLVGREVLDHLRLVITGALEEMGHR